MKSYNANNITWFIAVGDALSKITNGGSIGFKGYTDQADALGKGRGTYIEFVQSKDNNGREKGKWFEFNDSRRRFQVRVGETDIKGMKMYDFLKSYPGCEGSPNGTYHDYDGHQVQLGVEFRELNMAKDAEVALEAEQKRAEAIASALDVDEGTLSEIAANIAVFRDDKLADGQPDRIMRLHVFQFADKKPHEYFKLLNSGDRPVRAIVRKALADGTFSQRGTVIFWKETMLGADEDAAIATILREPRMLEVLQKKVDLKTTLVAKGKPGRPKKVTEEPTEE